MTSKLLAYLNEVLSLSLESIPSPNSIKNWVLKAGYSIYVESSNHFKYEDYSLITDESMMIGSEKMLLTLATKANKTGKTAMTSENVEIIDISIQPSWNSKKIAEVFSSIEENIGKMPGYVISDNASTISKAIRDKGYSHIKDVSHTLAMLIERQYKKNEAFEDFTKALAKVSFKENMKTTSYLLPPKQRTIARFMNLMPVLNWSRKLLKTFDTLTKEEQKVFSFIKEHEPIIDELSEIMVVYDKLSSLLKCKGLSVKNVRECKKIIAPMFDSFHVKVRIVAEALVEYLSEDVSKMHNRKATWHCSSDIIESLFGTYKNRKSANKLNGVTSLVMILPIITKINKETGATDINYKNRLEEVFLNEIDQWSKHNLTENLSVKRRKTLKAA